MRLRAGRYEPHRLTVRERRRAREYEQELEERLHELHTAQKHFQTHCELNRLEPTTIHAFVTFAVSLEAEVDPEVGPIKQGTRYSYLKKVMHALQSTTDPLVAKRRFVVDDAKELAAQSGRGHAPDYSLSVLHTLYHVAPSRARGTLWLAIALGLRNVDLQWLHPRALTFGRVVNGELQDLWVDVTFGKVIHSTGDRRTLHLRRSMLPGIPPPPELLQMIADGKDDFTEWEIASVDQMNRYLARMAPRTGLLFNRGNPTTYTLRRNFVHRVIESCRGQNGVVRWKDVTEYTLHFKEENVKAHYALTAEDRGLLGSSYDPWS